MKRITSRDNPTFKALRRLAREPAARHELQVAVIEGIHLADAYLCSGGVAQQVVVGQSALDHVEVLDLLDRSAATERFVLDDALFASLSQLAQGVPLLMIVAKPGPVPPARIDRTSVVLDRVQDPGNVGSILRSAAAAGIGDVYLSKDCASAWSPKVLRAAMGAHFALRLFEGCGLHRLKASTDLPWLATSPHAARSVFEADLRGHIVWVFGHEGQGLDPSLLDEACAVRIPQPGTGESLNVAASAAVCFFEQVRQRTAAPPG